MRHRSASRWGRWAAPAALAVASLGLGGVSEYPWRDYDNGWSMRTMYAWESRPPNLPGGQGDARIAAGWFPKDGVDGSFCVVVVFGSYFDHAVKKPPEPAAPADPSAKPASAAPAPKPAPPPRPARFPEWLAAFVGRFKRTSTGQVTGRIGEEALRKMGPDAGCAVEGEFSVARVGSYGGRTYNYHDDYKLLAAGVRRGDFEVGVLYFVDESTEMAPIKESAFSLRILEAKEMEKRRAELEAKEKKAGGGDEAWFAKIRARIPAGWKHFRRGDLVFIHDDGVTATSMENMAARLEAMRKKVYAATYPPLEDPESSCAVVKVTCNRRQYLAYGSPPNTLGYWSSAQRELVLFVQSDYGDDRADALSTLFHEGFHQYLWHALGGANAHPWFEEGHGDYYGGWKVWDGVPKKGVLELRQDTLRRTIEKRAWIPMGRLLKMEWEAFYGRGPGAVEDVGVAYAQAWSVVSFLREGGRGKLLDSYYLGLRDGVKEWRKAEQEVAAKEGRNPKSSSEMGPEAERGIRAAALEKAFLGVDLQRLEQEWLEWAMR